VDGSNGSLSSKKVAQAFQLQAGLEEADFAPGDDLRADQAIEERHDMDRTDYCQILICRRMGFHSGATRQPHRLPIRIGLNPEKHFLIDVDN
jgi:hypothetical protein